MNQTKNDCTKPNPFMIADHLALDFINSVAAPSGTVIEWLSDGEDLLTWLELTKLVPITVITQFRETADPSTLNSVTSQARELREWFRGFIKSNAGLELKPSLINELDPINRLLSQDNCYQQLGLSNLTKQDNKQDSFKFALQLNRQWTSPDTLLIPIAEIFADLLSKADFTQVKNCEGPSCTLWFNDISKNHARRWCSMAVCGNRAKAAAHRAKKQSAGK